MKRNYPGSTNFGTQTGGREFKSALRRASLTKRAFLALPPVPNIGFSAEDTVSETKNRAMKLGKCIGYGIDPKPWLVGSTSMALAGAILPVLICYEP